MKWKVADLKLRIRRAMDRASYGDAAGDGEAAAALAAASSDIMAMKPLQDGNPDGASLDALLDDIILPAIRQVETSCPQSLLTGLPAKNLAATPVWEEEPFADVARAALPGDYMRFVRLRMSDWHRAATEAVEESSPAYQRLRSRWAGVRASPERPAVAAVRNGTPRLEIYGSRDNNATMVEALYLPLPAIDDNGETDIADRLCDAVVWRAAYMASLALGDAGTAAAMKNLYKEELACTEANS